MASYLYVQLVAMILLSFIATISGQECSLTDQLEANSDPNLMCRLLNSGACNGLHCRVMGEINGTTALFAVQKCLDPVLVNLNLTDTAGNSDQVLQYSFTVNGTMSLPVDDGLSTVSVAVSVVMVRNATDLYFEAYAEVTDTLRAQLFPPVFVPLNPSVCMCASLGDLALQINSPLEQDCTTNAACNGVRCELNVFGNIFYIENIILPCNNSVELVVEDANRQPIHKDIFDRTEKKVIIIQGVLPLIVEIEITVYDYSMDIHAILTDPLFGETEIIPQHRIILDRTACDLPDIQTVMPPDITELPTIIPSRGATQTCLAFYDIAKTKTSEPFVCRLRDGCNGISCRLDILDTSYNIDIALLGCGESSEVSVTVTDESDRVLTIEKSTNFSFNLPNPEIATLIFAHNWIKNAAFGMKLDLSLSFFPFPPLVDILIPYTELPLDCPKSGLSSSEVAAVASVVPLAVILITVIVILLVVWGVFMYFRQRRRDSQFQFKQMSFNELRKKDTDPGATVNAAMAQPETAPAASNNEERGDDVAELVKQEKPE